MADIHSIGGNPIVPESVAANSVTDAMLAQTGGVLSAVSALDVLVDMKEAVTDTSFATQASTTAQTALEDIDPDYVSYNGYAANSLGQFTATASMNSVMFRCPSDNYAVRTNAGRMFIVSSPPDTVAGTVTIKSTLRNNEAEFSNEIIPNKGDLVLISHGTSAPLRLITQSGSPISMPRLFLSGMQDSLALYSMRGYGVNPYGNDKLGIQSTTGLLATASGTITASQTSYTTYYFQVKVPSLTVKCTNGFRALLCYSDPTTAVDRNVAQVLYEYPAGIVETFTVTYGMWVCISIANSSAPIALSTDLVQPFVMPTLTLDYQQLGSFYRYYENGGARYLYVYYKSGDKLVRWELHNVPAAASNSDTWQIGPVYGCAFVDGVPSNVTELVTGGEFELAFKEHGAADYCGGNNHGDETTDSFVLHIDGRQIADLTTLDGNYHKFDRIDAFEIATINRCDTPSKDILKHQKAWTFENGTVKVRQTIKFLDTLDVDGALICMFAANRASFPYGIRQGAVTIEDMSAQGFTHVNTDTNDMFYLMYGPSVTAKISARTDNNAGKSRLWINDTSTTNKLYYTYYSDSNSTYPKTVTADTVWQIESEYDVAYTAGA